MKLHKYVNHKNDDLVTHINNIQFSSGNGKAAIIIVIFTTWFQWTSIDGCRSRSLPFFLRRHLHPWTHAQRQAKDPGLQELHRHTPAPLQGQDRDGCRCRDWDPVYVCCQSWCQKGGCVVFYDCFWPPIFGARSYGRSFCFTDLWHDKPYYANCLEVYII